MSRLAAVALLGALLPTAAQATPIIDQACCSGPTIFAAYSLVTEPARAQTFTAGVTGTMTGIDVGLVAGGPLPIFELFAGAVSNGQALSSLGVPVAILSPVNTGIPVPGGIGSYFFSGLGAGVPVFAGKRFTIVQLPAVPGATGGWVMTNTLIDAYLGGEALSTQPGSPTNLLSTIFEDFAFRTYVEPASSNAVPEPTSMLLLGTGVVAAVARRRRSR